MEDNNNKKSPNVPPLRFPGFTDEWKKTTLGECCTFYSGGTPTSSRSEYYGGQIPFIRSGEIHSDNTELSITETGLKSSSAKMVSKGDLLLAMYGATSGEIDISKINGAINQAILCIQTTQERYFLKSLWIKHAPRILNTYLQGGQGNLSAEIIRGIKFSFPSILEQGKISRFISVLDQRIATQNKIIEDL
ncbi:MAG: restriction endonuclease subunit S, partial [Muribaculaceae bacterium]|nr:restriction endonuclease subunit S [Muribaculaceae bacterium]